MFRRSLKVLAASASIAGALGLGLLGVSSPVANASPWDNCGYGTNIGNGMCQAPTQPGMVWVNGPPGLPPVQEPAFQSNWIWVWSGGDYQFVPPFQQSFNGGYGGYGGGYGYGY